MAKKEKVTKEAMIGAWTGFIIANTVMVILAVALFHSYVFWMWFVLLGTGIGGISTTIAYYTRDSRVCPSCGARMDPGIEYCIKCGTRMFLNCPNCGAETKANARFCEKCGRNLSEPVAQFQQEPNQKPAQSRVFTGSTVKFCPACGNQIEIEAKHCNACGTEV